MHKLIIQIPCYNEEENLEATIHDLPQEISGIERIEYLVIDDGSTDRTVEVARKAGVHHVVELRRHEGLARAFARGIEEALDRGATIIVHTDADNQYRGADIPKLICPILTGHADLVIGDRQIDSLPHFSFLKKQLQKLGSFVVRIASGTTIPDATSGFRAFTRDFALRLHVFSPYTFTLETIIQAGQSNKAVLAVPIATNPPTRPSRLIKSTTRYVLLQSFTILRIFVIYKPFKFFGSLGAVLFSLGFLLGLRFLVFFFFGEGDGHIQSLILASSLLIIGFQLVILGLLADLIAVNRSMLEETQYHVRKQRG